MGEWKNLSPSFKITCQMTTIWNILEPTEMRLHKVQKQKPNFWVCNDVISSFFGSETKVVHAYRVKLFGSPPCKFLEIQWYVPVMQVLTAVFMLFIVFPWNAKRFAIARVLLFFLSSSCFSASGVRDFGIENRYSWFSKSLITADRGAASSAYSEIFM